MINVTKIIFLVVLALSCIMMVNTWADGGVKFNVDCTNPNLRTNIEAAAQNGFNEIQSYLSGLRFEGEIRIKVAESDRVFYDYLGDGFPDWGVGVAIPGKNLIVMKSPDLYNYPREFDEVLSHELAHLALHIKLKDHYIPRWFDEGFAQMVSSNWSIQQSSVLTMAVWTNNVIPLTRLETLNQFDQVKANLAYAESHSAVLFLYEQLGKDSFNRLLDIIVKSTDFEQGFYLATRNNIQKFSEIWQGTIKQKYHWAFLMNDPRFLYFLMLALFLLALAVKLIKKYRHKREQEEIVYYSGYRPPDPDKEYKRTKPEQW